MSRKQTEKKPAQRKAPAKKPAAKKPAPKKTAAKPAAKRAPAKRAKKEEARPVGRPPKYTDDMPERLLQFFKEKTEPEIFYVDGRKHFIAPRFPTMARFAAENGVARETLWDWANKRDEETGELIHPEFSNAYSLAQAYQEATLVEGAMIDAYKGSFAQFVAKNLLQWKDSRDLNVAGQQAGAPIRFEVVGVAAQPPGES